MKTLSCREAGFECDYIVRGETEEEILITRDGKPVAKLMRYSEPVQKRSRFDPEKHLAKMRKILGGTKLRYSMEERLKKSRADRFERR